MNKIFTTKHYDSKYVSHILFSHIEKKEKPPLLTIKNYLHYIFMILGDGFALSQLSTCEINLYRSF